MTTAQEDTAMAVDTNTLNDEILLAATNHDLEALRKLLRTGSARIQDPETGFSPLHAAIASCEADSNLNEEAGVDGEGDAVHSNALEEEAALATVQLLLENGAIWNDLDKNDETPGCIALRMGLKKVYRAIVTAGVMAELLFSRLDEYDLLPDNDEDEEMEDDDAVVGMDPTPSGSAGTTSNGQSNGGASAVDGFEPVPNPPTVPEVVQTDENGDQTAPEVVLSNPNVNNQDYLKSELIYSPGRLLDSDKNAVMMDWETEIMKASADKLCPKEGLRTMNIGHGMGIVDTMFLANNPQMHYIVEAHPAVQKHMRETGWYDKPNVTVCEGRWQDVLPKLAEQGVVLDALYYDTYAEDYSDLKELFEEHCIALIDRNGKFGFYNGLGADRQICYDVYTEVAEEHLKNAGFDVEWTVLQVPNLKGEQDPGASWTGIRRSYWEVPEYRLPTCTWVG
ncbi:related to Arginine N-methyltransferase 2 [Ramularia collo-cygni]|uniref:Arginine N-methyltransferase 2 n=1 Tax=Ramularia collo-cygni TaxID=112498 RepID=A0A2D3UYD2_9PEZI|nr:related to Arginine N-methyltransferase 2 [Ramularia collo-cygni]CZT14189.1 related to Arginine N-methyltransferase 2 [Ramularia collo-cygni]